MDVATPTELERYRAYLLVLARQQIPRTERAKLDPSGVVQQTLIDAVRAHDQFAELLPRNRLAWLRTALAHNLADEYRRVFAEKRNAKRELALKVDSSSDGMAQWLADRQPPVDERLDQSERMLQLAVAMADLPETQRDAIAAHYFQSKPVAEIARDMDKSPAAVAGLLKRGLRALRELLHETSETSP